MFRMTRYLHSDEGDFSHPFSLSLSSCFCTPSEKPSWKNHKLLSQRIEKRVAATMSCLYLVLTTKHKQNPPTSPLSLPSHPNSPSPPPRDKKRRCKWTALYPPPHPPPPLTYPSLVQQILQLDAEAPDNLVHHDVMVQHSDVQPAGVLLHRELERLFPLGRQALLHHLGTARQVNGTGGGGGTHTYVLRCMLQPKDH